MAVPFMSNHDLEDLEIAYRYTPVIRLDHREPFLPSRVGVTLFWQREKSPSFPGLVVEIPSSGTCAIEYAIWWDWDIQHLYELEHIWVSVASDGKIVAVAGSWHGTYRRFARWEEENGHPVLYSQPGKHAFAADPRDFPRLRTVFACTFGAGNMGLLVKPEFTQDLSPIKSKYIDRLIRGYLRRFAFVPSFRFDQEVRFPREALMSWEELRTYIPKRIRAVVSQLLEDQRC